MKPKNPSNAILAALAAQPRQGETSLTVRIKPALIQEAINVPGYRKLFAPIMPDLTEMAPIYAAYEEMRQAGEPLQTILVLVECQTIGEFVTLSSACRFENRRSGALLTVASEDSVWGRQSCLLPAFSRPPPARRLCPRG